MSARIVRLAADLRSALETLPGVTVRDRGPALCGLVTFTKDGIDPTALMARLREQRINVSVSSGPTHFDPYRSSFGPSVRASVHAYNDEAELARLVVAVRAA